jgi:hypothetical protein
MKVLRVKVNFETGKRAGGLFDPKGTDHRCNSTWQDSAKGVEYRILIEESKLDEYKAMDGVTVYDDLATGQAAIDAEFGEPEAYYKEENTALMQANINAKLKAADLDEMQADWTNQQELEFLYDKGISGISKHVKTRLKFEDAIN